MQSIQLYIQGERVEMFKDESVSLTQTIQNVRDIGSIFTDFSQSFTIPASKQNNKIFKHYYNYDINTAYSFSANDYVSAEIELNWRSFRKGYIGLDGVQMKDNKPHSYKITFFGETIDLKNVLKEIKLSDIFQSVTTYDHDYGVSNVLQGLETSLISGAIRYPLISHTERLFYNSTTHNTADRNLHYDTSGGGSGSHNHGIRYNDLKPALKLSKIIDEIEAYTGLTFSSGSSDDFFDETNNPIWANLYLWLSRVKGNLGLSVSGSSFVNMPLHSFNFSSASPNEWNVQGLGTDPNAFPYSRINDGTWTIRGNGGSTYFSTQFIINSSSTYTMILEDVTSTPVVIASVTGTGVQQINEILQDNALKSYRFRVTSEDLAITFTPTIVFVYYTFSNNYSTAITGTAIQPNGAVTEIVLGDQMPDIKVIDFLTGLFKMFNLTAYVQNDGVIKVLTLDDFYASGIEYDISKYIDVNESEVNFSIPFQEIGFRFQKPDTFLAFNFSEINNKVFGDIENTTTTQTEVQTTNRGGKYVVTLPFGKMLYERINDDITSNTTPFQYGYCVDKDQSPVNIKPLIMAIENEDCSSDKLSFYNGVSSGTADGLSTYNRPSNVFDATTNQSLNFGSEIDEYTGTVENNSLFYTYYRNYIVDTFNPKRRITKVTAYLPLNILLNYKLADVFVINNQKYIINSIKTNLQDGKSEIELLNVL